MSGSTVDLRERIIAQWQQGQTQNWLAETFGVNISSVKRYIAQYRAVGHVQPKVQGRMKPTIGHEQLGELDAQLAAHSSATLAEHVALWEASHGVRVSITTMWTAIERAGWTYKKRAWVRASAMKPNG